MLIIVRLIGLEPRTVLPFITTNVRPSGTRLFRRLIALFTLMFFIAGNSASEEQGSAKSTQSYHYQLWDVFTDKALAGNQLAVFTSAQGLSADLMQKIAREMAFSETTFVFGANESGIDAHVRIFSPTRELAFAGHPTIGTAFALVASGATGTFNFTNAGETSWHGFASAILDEGLQAGFDIKTETVSPIPTIDYPTPATRPAYSVLNTEKIRPLLAGPIPGWRESLKKMLQELYKCADCW